MKSLVLFAATVLAAPAFAKTVTCQSYSTSTVIVLQLDPAGNPVGISGADLYDSLHLAGLAVVGPASQTTTRYSFRAETEDANCTLDLENPARLLNAATFNTHLVCTTIDGSSNQDGARDRSGKLIPGETVGCTVR